MKLEDEFKYLVGGYYGVMEMDEYDLKVYVLKDIENYIRAFINENPIPEFDYKKEAEESNYINYLEQKVGGQVQTIYEMPKE